MRIKPLWILVSDFFFFFFKPLWYQNCSIHVNQSAETVQKHNFDLWSNSTASGVQAGTRNPQNLDYGIGQIEFLLLTEGMITLTTLLWSGDIQLLNTIFVCCYKPPLPPL